MKHIHENPEDHSKDSNDCLHLNYADNLCMIAVDETKQVSTD